MPAIARVILYVKDIPKVAEFYQRHFGLKPLPSSERDGWSLPARLEAATWHCIKRPHLRKVEQP